MDTSSKTRFGIWAVQIIVASIFVLWLPIVLCDTGEANDSVINIHPVVKLSSNVQSLPENVNRQSKPIARVSNRRSLSSPISVPTIPISNNGIGSGTSSHNASSGKDILCLD